MCGGDVAFCQTLVTDYYVLNATFYA